MSSIWKSLSSALLGTALLVSTGCGGGDKNPGVDLEPVTGTVLLDGSPVEGATVVFHGEQGASGITDSSGKFTLTTFDPGDGAKVGVYKVTVSKSEMVGVDDSYNDVNSPNYGKEAPPAAAGKRKFIIAEKFSKADTAGLTADVQSGANDFTFEVTGS